MKNFSKIISNVTRVLSCILLACVTVVSCYDDTLLRDQLDKYQEEIDLITDRILELEDKMNSEIGALKSMLKGQFFISDVSRNAATGVVTLTLSDGNTLQLYPEADLKSTVTYQTIGGVDYWAYIDEKGNTQLFKNEKGEGIPVASATPEVVVVDGEYYIVLGGMQYPLGGNSIFSNYELLTDELTGEIYAVSFTFGEDMTFTVTVDGACCFNFVMQTGAFGRYQVIEDYYVPTGSTERVKVDARGVVDYVIQAPDGWKVSEYRDVYTSELYLDIKAPTVAEIESGAAVSEGNLKAVVVLQGGKATIARLRLSSAPFKVFSASMDKVYIEMNNGLQKYVCGVCPAADFDEDALETMAEELLTLYEYPAGCAVMDTNIDGMTLSEAFGTTLEYGQDYVLWAFPALYFSTESEEGFYIMDGSIETCRFTQSSISLEVDTESYSDVTVNFSLNGVEAYYMGVVTKDEYLLEDVLFNLNLPDMYQAAVLDGNSYSGSIFTLAGVTPESDVKYVAWVAPAGLDREYTENDLVVVEFATLTLTPGSDVNVTASEPSATAINIVTDLTATGAKSIYYAYLTTSEAKKYADDAAKAEYLFAKGLSVNAETVEARLEDFSIKVKPNTNYVLWAVASDFEGKYGEVMVLECSTSELAYNDLTIDIKLVSNNPGKVVLSIESEDAEGFVYWVGSTSDNTWKSTNYLGGTVESAQSYLYQNSTAYRITSLMEKYPIVDGKITMTDLNYDVEHIIVIMAKDSDGMFSYAHSLKFTPSPVAIGTVVLSSDSKWEAAKPTVEYIPESFEPATGMMPGRYEVNVTLPLGYTGYVACATDSFFNEGDDSRVLTPEQLIIGVIQTADVQRDHVNCIDEEAWVTLGYPHGHEVNRYPHGAPSQGPKPGYAVIWGSEEFHHSVCDCHESFTDVINIQNVDLALNHFILYNDGKPIRFVQPYAIASTLQVIDKVFIVLQDADGNCYETYKFDVPVELFANAQPRE